MGKTKDNLKTAFIEESQARNRYTWYAEMARKEGFRYIAKIFDEIADNEKYHALEEYRLLYGESNTIENLKEAIDGEDYESEKMYPKFATEAEVEGDTAAAILFSQIAKIEKHHRERFKHLLKLVKSDSVFKREESIRWKCSVCGYAYEGTEPPNRCPYCKRPKEFYEPANLDV